MSAYHCLQHLIQQATSSAKARKTYFVKQVNVPYDYSVRGNPGVWRNDRNLKEHHICEIKSNHINANGSLHSQCSLTDPVAQSNQLPLSTVRLILDVNWGACSL